MRNERLKRQRAQEKVAGQIMEDKIEINRTDVSKKYGQATAARFTNGLTTTETVSLCMNILAWISDVSKAVDANYSTVAENDDRSCYRRTQEDGGTDETLQEARK